MGRIAFNNSYNARILIFLLGSTNNCHCRFINYFPENIDSLISSIIPEKFNIFNQFSPIKYADTISNNRNTIFLFALKMISKSPFIGMGAATFPIYYYMENDIYLGHTHNLFIDVAFSYGIFVALLIFINIFLLSFLSIRKIYLLRFSTKTKDIYFERAWCTSFVVLLFSQMFDVQYFDLRISISFWVLLSGMKSIISEKIFNHNSQIKLSNQI